MTTNTRILSNWFLLFSTLLILCIFVAPACKKDNPEPDPNPVDTTSTDTITNPIDTMTVDTMGVDTMNSDTIIDPPIMGCDDSLRPLVFMHGALASGDTYAQHFMRFTSNDYCPERIFAFDWNTLSQDDSAPLLDEFIDDILAKTGADKVDLAGHSAGGGLGYNYISDPTRADKVAHYVHIGSFSDLDVSGIDVPVLNIWSSDDLIVPGADINGVENLQQTGADHYQVATNATTFEAMYTFFNDGRTPMTTEISAETTVSIAGRVVTFGENNPLENASVEVYTLDATTGLRISDTPDFSLSTNATGHWGPFEGIADTYYEFTVQGTDDPLPVNYFREPFSHSNHLVYLRTLPPPTSLAGILLRDLPDDDEQTTLIIFAANQAVIHQRDVLHVNNTEISTEKHAAAETTAIAFFLYDDGDQSTSLGSVGLFGTFGSFLSGIDFFLPTIQNNQSIQIQFNGRILNVPNYPSGSKGPVVAILE